MTTGILRRVFCAILALALAVAAAGLAVDVVAVGTGHAPVFWPQRAITGHLEDSRWGDPAIMAVAAAVALIGLLLLWAALSRGRHHRIRLRSGDEQIDVSTTRRSLRRILADTAGQVEGVDAHRVRIRGHRVKCRVTTPMGDRETLREHIGCALEDQLTELRTAHAYRTTVKVRSTRGVP
ncbi:DUF6286 domain-containing protein [Streptacidiphilus griseoplanus]|uniref:DUF6286 domain-containing protein n=1 Tax=Peterkaempfera griseoplana TaxID=66896 RepID=UPI0006E3AD66|nr:DUF6286 domain-containing protein [Peterkaempfera griseoplana]